MARPSREKGSQRAIEVLIIGKLGKKIKKITWVDVVVDPASIAASTTGETNVTVTGAAVGDFVFAIPPSTLDAGIVVQSACRVSGADTAVLRLGNTTVGAINVASATWRFLHVDLT